MKTKKNLRISQLLTVYGIIKYVLPITIVIVCLVIWHHYSFLSAIIIFVVSFLAQLVVKRKTQKKLDKKIFEEWLFYLKKRVKEHQKRTIFFPTKEEIKSWLSDFSQRFSLGSYPAELLENLLAGARFYQKHFMDTLQKCIVQKDITLEDLYCANYESEGENIYVFLQYLTMKDVVKFLSKDKPLLGKKEIKSISLRKGKDESFEDFLELVYSKKLHLCLTDDAIALLMKYAESIGLRERRDFSVAKPLMRKILLFLSYYVSIKEDTIKEEKRIAIFQWLIDQQAKCFASESDFFYIWPLFIAEELNILKANLNPLDYGALCIKKEIWKELSDDQLRQLLVYLNTPNNKIKDTGGFLKEVSNRWIF